MSARSEQAKSIFLEAIERHVPEEWPAFLEQACGGDTALRTRVEKLLRAQAELGSFREEPGTAAVPKVNQPVLECPGTLIGPYKLLEQIGEGGFAVVFMAEQEHPVRRKVALKVLKPGMDSRQVIARFEAERQALALMDHASIARVFDGGETPTGRPYFVMELVKGIPITDYCDENQLTPRERLELFTQVCQAVQHAHQKGIIHRDLKPSNILVTLHDTVPVVKVIDFGIAKATGQRLTDKTLFTNFAQLIGTPLYMSPEQAGLSGLDVDTRSDIYSLGVLLYELLTGTTPFAKDRFKEVGYDEILRIIREEEPPKPSTRISTLGESATRLSLQRKSDPKRLKQLFRGELDWIVAKCLEKDRNRRYQTANSLALDVHCYLHDEPVQACPPSALYRFGKFARRNRAVLTTVSLVALALIAGAAVSAWLALRATRAEALAHTRMLAEQAARLAESKRRGQARDALDAMTSLTLEDLLARQPTLTEEHKRFLRRALQAYEEFAQETAEDEASRYGAARALANVARIHLRLAPTGDAVAVYRQGVTRFEQLVADFPTQGQYQQDLSTAQRDLGRALEWINEPAEARKALAAALASGEKLIVAYPDESEYRHNQALNQFFMGQLGRVAPRESEKCFQKAIALLEPLVARSPTVQSYRALLARTEAAYSGVLATLGRSAEAVSACRRAANIVESLVAEAPKRWDYRHLLAQIYNNLSNRLRDGGRPEEIEKALRDALALERRLAADFPGVAQHRLDLAIMLTNLGSLLNKNGRPGEAEPLERDAVLMMKRLVGDYPEPPEHWQVLSATESDLGDLLVQTKRLTEADDHFVNALAAAREQAARLPQGFNRENTLAIRLSQLGDLRRRQGQLQASCDLLQQAFHHFEAALKENPQHPTCRARYRDAFRSLAGNYLDLGDHAASAGAIDRFTQLAIDPANDLFAAACLWSRCAASAGKDQRLTQENRKQRADDYASRGVQRLQEAVTKGFKDARRMKTDEDLEALRGRPDFKRLLVDLEARTKGQPQGR
jgi:serine/threonine protein kinase/tetratricopeptide (TPR) repeat protein